MTLSFLLESGSVGTTLPRNPGSLNDHRFTRLLESLQEQIVRLGTGDQVEYSRRTFPIRHLDTRLFKPV
jgi:hypothetical protein